jgi:hypothetical protein
VGAMKSRDSTARIRPKTLVTALKRMAGSISDFIGQTVPNLNAYTAGWALPALACGVGGRTHQPWVLGALP